MSNVTAADRNQPRPWQPCPHTLGQLLAGMNRPYPPAGRSGAVNAGVR